MKKDHIDKELIILEKIYKNVSKRVRQRDLAHLTGISLGMTNTILKRLVTKGLLAVKKINHHTIHYAVTPAGIKKMMHRSYAYIKKTITNIGFYRDKIKELLHTLTEAGYRKIVFVGESDLDFIFEHYAKYEGLYFEKKTVETEKDKADESCFIIISGKTGHAVNLKTQKYLFLLDFIHFIDSHLSKKWNLKDSLRHLASIKKLDLSKYV